MGKKNKDMMGTILFYGGNTLTALIFVSDRKSVV